jgi:hypothetical protein
MTTKFANFSKTDFYTLVTPTTIFDVANAIEFDFACTWSESYAADMDQTYTWCLDYNDKPTAAATSVVYRTAAAPFPPGGVIPTKDASLYDLYTEQPVATHAISIAPNRTFEQISATPVVHFTAYEVDFGNRTETVQLASAYVYPYWAKDVQHDAVAKGPIPDEFVQQTPHADCDAGELQAVVTVVVVVDLYYEYFPFLFAFLIHVESTALGFDDGPVVINNEGSTRGVPLTIDDWNLFGGFAEPTPEANTTPNSSPDPLPTTKAGSNNNNNNNQQGAGSIETQVPNVSQVTVGGVGTIPVVIGPSSVVVVGSQTLQPGGPNLIIGGVTPVSLVPAATAIVVGGATTLQLPQVSVDPARPPPILTIGSSTLTANAATQFFVAPGQTLSPGNQVTIDGRIVSLAPSALFVVVDGVTQVLPTATPRIQFPTNLPQIVVGGTTIAAQPVQGGSDNPGTNSNNNQNDEQNNDGPGSNSGPKFVVGGQTLSPGGQAITVSGTTLSLANGGSSIVVNGVTSAVANPPASFAPTIAIGNSIFTPVSGSGNMFVIGDQTLTPGGQALTISGTVISLAPSSSYVVVNGVTSSLATSAIVAAAQITIAPALTIGSDVFQPLPGIGTSYLIGSSVLTPGGVITVSGTTISLAPSASEVVINGQTSSLTHAFQPVITNAPLLTIGSNTFTALSGTTYVIGGQTLKPGAAITINGTTISLAPGATQLIYGSSGQTTTTALFPATTTPSQSITGASTRASGNNGQATATDQRTGSASNTTSRLNLWSLSLFITALGLVLC